MQVPTNNFQAKVNSNNPLPPWLLFDKTDGIFWGVPLADDSGVLHITIKHIGQSESTKLKYEFDVVVKEKSPEEENLPHACPSTEDSTILSLLLDRDVEAIKPKQRVMAINNIAKFLGLPYVSGYFCSSKQCLNKRNSFMIRYY